MGTLAGGVAHEFNNILSGIMGCASYLQMRMGNDSEAMEYLDMILKASRQASALTRQLLGVIRKTKSRHEAFSLNEMVDELALMLSHTFPRNIEIKSEIRRDLPPAEGTPAQVHQALLNLCVNAKDAMPDGGVITLATGLAGPTGERIPPAEPDRNGFVFVSVSDTGGGITDEIRDRIFEPFFTTKPTGKGTGLGLSMVRGIVSEHEGMLEVSSEPGKGARFTICLPRSSSKPGRAEARDDLLEEKGSGRILIVDDEKINLMVLDKVLSGHGFKVFTATSGERALEVLEERDGNIDLILLDLVMPGIGGVRTLEEINSRYPGCKTVILTGMADENLSKDLLESGASAFIQKPLDAREILKAVIDAIE
jgi:CheY-like chemotaxis protein